MEVPAPTTIQLDLVTQGLISDATELADVVNRRNPLPAAVREQIQKDLLEEMVYNSNAIEGSTLTLRQTKEVLQSQESLEREAREAINLADAIDQVRRMVHQRDAWSSLEAFLGVHRTLLTGVNDGAAGCIRDEPVVISGAPHQPPAPEEVEPLLHEFFSSLNKAATVDPLLLASWTHWAVSYVHPFQDGNGRMARVWQDLILSGHGFPAALIRLQDRREYYDSLGAADRGNFDPLTQLIARSLSRTLQVYLNASREVDELNDWAASLMKAASSERAERRRLEYLRFTSQFEQLRDSFQRCATQINSVSDDGLEIRFQPFEMINQPTWETVRAAGPSSNPWYFWLRFRRGEQRLSYCFYFASVSSLDPTKGDVLTGPNVSLHVAEQESDGQLHSLDTNESVSLREIVFADGQLTRRRYLPAEDVCINESSVLHLDIAREFVEEVLLKRLG